MTDRTAYDGPWKQILEDYFVDFIAFFFPDIHADVAWEKGYKFLDKELQQVTRKAEMGQRLADKLVEVQRLDGTDSWVLIHIEVQSQPVTNFAERMYVYNYRLYDRYRQRVASLAVLGDEQADWHPQAFGYTLWGSRVAFEYPVVKLLDYWERWTKLEADFNPFATVTIQPNLAESGCQNRTNQR